MLKNAKVRAVLRKRKVQKCNEELNGNLRTVYGYEGDKCNRIRQNLTADGSHPISYNQRAKTGQSQTGSIT
jgi:hypothetical protein